MSCGRALIYFTTEPAVTETSPYSIISTSKDPWYLNHFTYFMIVPLFVFQLTSARWAPFIKSLSKGESRNWGKILLFWYTIILCILLSALFESVVEPGLTAINQFICNDLGWCTGTGWLSNELNRYWFQENFLEISMDVIHNYIGLAIVVYVLMKYRLTYWGEMSKFGQWKTILTLLLSFAWNLVIGIYVQLDSCKPAFSSGPWNIVLGMESLNAIPVGIYLYWFGQMCILFYSSYEKAHTYPEKYKYRIGRVYLSIMFVFTYVCAFAVVPVFSTFIQIYVPFVVLLVGYFIYCQMHKNAEPEKEEESDDDFEFNPVQIEDK